MTENQRPKTHMTGHMLRNLGQFVDALNKASREHSVDVCPYGSITIEVSGHDSEMRFSLHREGEGQYVVGEQL